MKALQLFALILALGVAPAFAQQEIDPDHFDQPAAKAAVQKSHGSHLNAQRQHRHSQNLASRAHHHHSHNA
jgi:hypothetical protein